MNILRYTLIIGSIFTYSTANAKNCENIFALSKTKNETIATQTLFEQHANNFCSEYARTNSDSYTAKAKASYKFLSASGSYTNASYEEVASKYCSAHNASSASSDAYKNYVESISPNTFTAYSQCLKSSNEVTFDLNPQEILAKEFVTEISFRPKSSKNKSTTLEYFASNGIQCKWNENTINQSKITLSTNSKAILSCNRQDSRRDGFVKISRLDSTESGEGLTIPWGKYNSDNEKVYIIDELKNQINDLKQGFDKVVVPYAASQCPTGWREYLAAQGLFIRGLDKTRTLGSIQDDSIGSHTHEYMDIYWSEAHGYTENGHYGSKLIGSSRNDHDNRGLQLKRVTSINHNAGTETRPKNIALLYCTPNK